MKGLLFLGLVLLVVSFLSLVSITPLYPINEEITKTSPMFKWSGNAKYILIDDNPDFSSPIIEKAEGGEHSLEKPLSFGVHYWKLKGYSESKTSMFTINSIVDLELEKTETNQARLLNSGNSDIKVFHYEKRNEGPLRLTGLHSLKINEAKDVQINSKSIFIARQDE